MVLPCAHALDQLEGEMFSCLSPPAHAAVSLVEGRGSVSFALCAVSATDSTGHRVALERDVCRVCRCRWHCC